jgi:hypothetical protein
MVAVDELIVSHARAPYDPVKRREYYLRTRQLKGRPTGSKVSSGDRKFASIKSTSHVDPHKAQKQRREKRKKELDAKVAALRERLDKLQDLLVRLVLQAKSRSGVKPTVKAPTRKSATAGSKESKTSQKKTTTTEKRTVTEKREAAKRSKEYYEKNVKGRGPSKSTEIRRLKSKIEDTEQMIENVREDLKASITRARQKAKQSKPAAKSRQTSKKGNDQNGS